MISVGSVILNKGCFLLALDQGGHASRASIFNPFGRLLIQATCKIKTHRPASAHVEHDPQALIDSLLRCIDEVLLEWGETEEPLVAALATQRSSIVAWHRADGRALTSVISWQDLRAVSVLEDLALDERDVHRRTGLFPSAHYGASKLSWCLQSVPEVASAAAENLLAFGPLSSYIVKELTEEGHYLVDPANASRTLLWNIDTGDWDSHLCRTFGIPMAALPKVVSSKFDFGVLAGQSRTIPLVCVTGDQSAALFGAGWPREEALYLNMGTGAFLQRVRSPRSEVPSTKNRSVSAASRLLSGVVLHDGKDWIYSLEGTINGAASALHRFGDEFDAPEWPEMTELWLAESKSPPLYLNAVGGLASPYWCPRLRSVFIGSGNKAERFTAVLESILFLIQRNVEEMDLVLDAPEEIVVSGGLSQWDGLCQRLANLSKLPVLRNSEHEGTSRGLATLVLNSKHLKLSSNSGFSKTNRQFLPEPHPKLAARYRLWQVEMQSAIEALESSEN